MLYRLILANWAKIKFPTLKPVIEGELTDEQVREYNKQHYNVYYLPNYPSEYDPKITVDGSHIDVFQWVFVDMDLKDKVYASKEEFLELLCRFELSPTRIIDSGHGIHAYWQITDLTAMDFLRIQRRLIRKFKTDDSMAKIFQLMRVPGSFNTKDENNPILCEEWHSSNSLYTCEDFDKALPAITKEDELYCENHYNKTYKLESVEALLTDKIPLKFAELIRSNQEVKNIWAGGVDDRSKADYRLGHIMFAHSFTKEEALAVLVNSSKALSRAPSSRLSYATGIIEKIWTFELPENKQTATLSRSVREILSKSDTLSLKGTRFPCHKYLDATEHGFRLGQVIGLVAGSGVGKTAMALNMFQGFVQNNPDYDHFFVPLEQPVTEIADRWRVMCGDNESLHDKVQIISNYDDKGQYRHLSLDDIKDYIAKFQKDTGRKIGCVVIDHIGALKKSTRDGENQGLMDICHSMKAFAVQLNVLLVMQSQAPREKAGIGDLELNKDAAYGTLFFEAYCDFLMTIWQPLKRCYSEEGCPTVTAFKFCKIRHKMVHLDQIMEDVCYRLFFDPKKEKFRELTQDEEKTFDFFAQKALNIRKKDRKTDLVEYQSTKWVVSGGNNGKSNSYSLQS